MRNSTRHLTLGALLFALSLPAQAQPAKIPRVGYLNASSAAVAARYVEAFRQGLREVGYVEGKNIVVEYRYGELRPDRVPAIAAYRYIKETFL